MLGLSVFPLCQNPSVPRGVNSTFLSARPCRGLHPTRGGAKEALPFHSGGSVWPEELLSHKNALIFSMKIKAAIQAKGETIVSRCKLYQQVPEEATQSPPRFLPK